MRHILAFFILLAHVLTICSQPICNITRYDENNGLTQWHVTQILQDKRDMIWLATWNGLNRFDGYEFECFKTHVGDGCDMPTDRIRNIWLADDGNINCKVDEQFYKFNLKSYSFSKIRNISENKNKNYDTSLLTRKFITHKDRFGTQWVIESNGKLSYYDRDNGKKTAYPIEQPLGRIRFCLTDRQGNLWFLGEYGIYRLCFMLKPIKRLPQQKPAQVRCLFKDKLNRYWLTTKEDATIRIFDSKDRLLGYLGKDGNIHKNYVSFVSPVYCITQTHDGTIWMGSKPDGLLRMKEQGNGHFKIDRIEGLNNSNIYDIKEDKRKRLWIATLGGGINCIKNAERDKPLIINSNNGLKNYPESTCGKVRYIHITQDDILIAATTEGLLVSDAPQKADVRKAIFNIHTREAHRKNSLSCSATMDIAQDARQRIFISTESGGVNMITSRNIMDGKLRFHHYNIQSGLPTDVALSTTIVGSQLWVVCSNQILILNPDNSNCEAYDSRFFMSPVRFSDAHPIQTRQGKWIFGLQDGAFEIEESLIKKSSFVPPLALTSISIQGRSPNMAVNEMDSLILQPEERNVTIQFAALDYSDGIISYAFRMGNGEDAEKNYIGQGHTATLLDLKPGTYQLQIKSTNADGVWVDNTRTLNIIVIPLFSETIWAKLLFTIIALLVMGIIVYIYIYIKRIKRQQRETLDAYLAILNKKEEDCMEQKRTGNTVNAEDDKLMKRVMDFVEQHIGDADINIGDMASAAATSRSGLQRKIKQITGITPLDLLREARIKQACHLLHNSDKTITEIAFSCGFSDPKYFSRSFRSSVGMSPTEYKNKGSIKPDCRKSPLS